MLTNPIKRTQMLSELQTPIKGFLIPWNSDAGPITDNFIIAVVFVVSGGLQEH